MKENYALNSFDILFNERVEQAPFHWWHPKGSTCFLQKVAWNSSPTLVGVDINFLRTGAQVSVIAIHDLIQPVTTNEIDATTTNIDDRGVNNANCVRVWANSTGLDSLLAS